MLRTTSLIRKARVTVVGVAIVVGTGYASNLGSERACLQYAIGHTPPGVLRSKPVFAYQDFSPGSLSRWRDFGVDVTPCNQDACFPWVGARRPRSLIPFVVELEWGYGDLPLAARMARTRLLCLFGWVVPLSERDVAS